MTVLSVSIYLPNLMYSSCDAYNMGVKEEIQGTYSDYTDNQVTIYMYTTQCVILSQKLMSSYYVELHVSIDNFSQRRTVLNSRPENIE